jgi:bidirectional [NiFe] hydrogenase diaphorase subunit
VKGARTILRELEQNFGIRAGQVTEDNSLGLQVARCVGACGMAPVAVVDDAVEGNVNAADLTSEIRAKIKGT